MQLRRCPRALGLFVVWQLLSSGCIEAEGGGAGGGSNDGAGSEGGATACPREYERITERQLFALQEAPWPGPLLMSRASNAGDIGYVSLDEGGTVRWLTTGLDYVHAGVALWQAEGRGVVVSEGEHKLRWPLSLSVGLSSIALERVDDRYIAARLTATSGDSDQLWVLGGLCHGCGDEPPYPCAFDFDGYWQVVGHEE